MSTTIDQKVVEMRFDNKHFENNVRNTMSTLDKLKQKLNLKGASKGLDDLSASANKVNMNGLSTAVETVSRKFSAMDVIGVTALANITNSAVNAGKRIAKALTIEPVMSGFNEYETQINAVQTILANTQKEGTNIDIVNSALDELNEYADQTIYNFTEMTRNIGTFTAAGVKLDDSVAAIKGISNLAAVSGSSSQQASVAMYQLSQALANGKANLQDWNSVVNAGMGGQVFQDALKRTAKNMGTNVDAMIKKYGSFRESISKGDWLTSEVLTKTLEQFTMAAEEGSEQWEKYKKSLMDEGYTAKQAEEILKLANTATDAATKVKTFTQLWDVVKESVQSGWAQTWRLIIGDFEEAKALFTPIAEFLTGKNGIITRLSNARNDLLKGALSFNPFTAMLDKLENSGMGKIVKKVSGITRSLEEYQKVVKNVWRGNYNNRGDNPDRFDLLEKEGWNPHVVQTLVNKGSKYKLTVQDIEKAEKKYGLTTTETVKAVEKLSDEQLRNAGLTEDEIEMYRALEKQSAKTGKSIDEIVKSMNQKDGRTLLIESFKNVGSSIAKILNAIGAAWNDAFGLEPIQLYNFIAGLNEFSTHLKMSDKTAENLTRTLKGVFAIVDLVTMVIGGGFKIAFTILKTVLGMFNLDILQFTAILGDAIVAFRNWVEEHNPLVIVIKKLVPLIIKMGKAIGDLAKKLWELPAVQKVVTKIANAFKKLGDIKLSNITSALKSLGKNIKKVFSNINERFGGVPGDILAGLANGLKNGASKVINGIATLATTLIEKFEKLLGIESPSKVFFAIGGFIIAGLIGGLLSGSGDIGDTMSTVAGKVTEFFKETDWGKVFSKIFTGGMSVGLLMVAKNVTDSVKNFSSLAGGLGSMFEGVGEVTSAFADNMKRITKSVSKVMNGFAKVMKGIAFKKYAEGIKEIAWSLLIMVGAIAILTLVDTTKLDDAVKTIGQIAVILGVLTYALSKMSQSSISLEKGKGLQINSVKTVVLNMALALLAMGAVIKMIGKLKPEQYEQGVRGLTDVVVLLGALIATYGLLIKGKGAQNMDKAAKMIKKMGTALLVMAVVMKIVSLLKPEEILQGWAFMAGFIVFTALLFKATDGASKNIDKVGWTLIQISVAMLLLVKVIEQLSYLTLGEVLNGVIFAAAFALFIKYLVNITKIGKENQIAQVGKVLLSVSIAMLIMVGVIKLLGGMDIGTLAKGVVAMIVLAAVIEGLIYAVKASGNDTPKLALTILAIGVAMGILAGVAAILSLIDIGGLAKGVVAIGFLSVFMKMMIKATKDAKDIKGSLIVMTVAIGIMAAAVALLSFIDPTKLIAPTIAMGLLMGLFALIENQSKHVNGSWTTILAMVGVIAALSIALYKLAKLPIGNVIGSAIGLSILMGTFALIMKAMNGMGGMSAKALLGVAGIAALCATLYIVVDVLKRLSGVENVAQNAIALAGFMTIMSLVLLATAGVGAIYAATAGIAATGLLGIVALIGTLYLLMGALAIMSNIPDAITNLNALTSFLKTLTGILVILAVVGPFALIGVTALSSLTILMGAIGVFAVAIGALMQQFPALQSFLDIGLPVLIQLAGGIGQMIGAFVSGIITEVAATLPVIGTMLSQFMINALPFITTAMLVDSKVLEGVGIMAAAILLLSAANIIEGITAFLSGGESFASLGTELTKFATNALPFFATVMTIKPGTLEGVKALAEAILILTGANMIERINKFLGGESSLSSFGTQLTYLGTGLKDFIAAIGPISDDEVKIAQHAATIIKTLASAAKEIPNTGGLLGELVGENDMSTWAVQLPLVATGIVGFTKILSENKISEDSIKIADTAASVIKTLASAAKEIPNTGGLLADLIGDNDLATFASGLPEVGNGIAGFVTAMRNAEITEDQAKVANTAADIIKTLAKVSKDIPNTGGMLAALIGDNDLKTFADGLPDVGKGIAGFCKKVAGLSNNQVDSVNAATKMLTSIVNLGKLDLGKYKSSLSSFGTTLETFATNIGTFATSMNNIGSFNIMNANSGITYLLNMVKNVSEADISSLKTLSDTLKTLGKESVSSFVAAFTGDTPKLAITTGAKGLCDAVTGTLKSKTFEMDVKTAGASVSNGFAAGIRQNKYIVSIAGTEIGEAALTAAKAAIDSNSPSKEAMKIGNYFGQGLVIGINQYRSKTYDTAYSIGDDAKSGLTRAISRISSVIDNDIDTQPTIRPVLDLSDVESGAGYLNTMFNNNPSIGANLSAISSSMNHRRQNGNNSDVVSAIDSLRKDLGNVGGTTNNYNVNGVAYADTDNDINNAVKTLVRAAITERRT